MGQRRSALPLRTGGCLCGDVRFEIYGELRPIIASYCEQCRRTTGHYMAATAVHTDNLSVTIEDGLRWYRSSPDAKRGFCCHCGSSMFWQGPDESFVSISVGALDDSDGLALVAHIFVADKGAYYEIDDGVPQFPESNHNVSPPQG